ncbi:MAG: hypothetical protein PWR20_2472 [Bacteroidales bacterium]|nr:hypothetical protein [Bacteroidales bacterium]MDN5328751.1 hypothetical protein [Bacteroidales bacterium]
MKGGMHYFLRRPLVCYDKMFINLHPLFDKTKAFFGSSGCGAVG